MRIQSNQENQSEVARLRALMDSEREAMRLIMNGFAVTSTHEFITARMENMGVYHEELKELIGEQEATRHLAAALQGPSTP